MAFPKKVVNFSIPKQHNIASSFYVLADANDHSTSTEDLLKQQIKMPKTPTK